MSLQLVIFDCDGVLVNSEPISIGLLIDHCARSGFKIGEKESYDCFLGRPVADAHLAVKEKYGRSIPPVDLATFQREIMRRFRSELRPVAGVSQALDAITLRKCVASSSSMERIRECLALTKLSAYFEPNLASVDLVERGKPHPDVFLYAADMMNTSADETIVVEDSPAGIRAAKAAGMKIIAFTGGNHSEIAGLKVKLSSLSPDSMIATMTELPAAIRFLEDK